MMARNIEIKARIEGIEAVRPGVEAVADRGLVEIVQDDTFFACPNGRLKLRVLAPDRGELIFYLRDDGPGPRESCYVVSPTGSPETLRLGIVPERLVTGAYVDLKKRDVPLVSELTPPE